MGSMEVDILTFEDLLMDDPYIDMLGFGHHMDLDLAEQSIIDNVIANITIDPDEFMLMDHVKPVVEEPIIEQPVVNVCQLREVTTKDQNAIEATDVGSLLEQFEEASQSMDSQAVERTVPVTPTISETGDPRSLLKTGPVLEKKALTTEVIQKLKSAQKPKTAVMLPMMVPAKRGRGRAMTRGHPVAMPANCTPRRLQRVMMKNAELKGSLAISEGGFADLVAKTSYNTEKSSEIVEKTDELDEVEVGKEFEVTTEIKAVNEKKWAENKIQDEIIVNNMGDKTETEEIKELKTSNNVTEGNVVEVIGDHDYIKSENGDKSESDPKCAFYLGDELEDGEVFDDVEIDTRDNKSGAQLEESEEPGQYFDKLPGYFTALSIPRKQIRKTASCAYNRGGITVHDYIQRAISPVHDTSAYSKLPDYCSSFTNSTKYDSFSDASLSKTSSGYSSLSQSPSRRSSHSKSPSRSNSRSNSVSRSRSQSRVRSRSRSRKPRNHEKRNYRIRRQSSYSSCSGYTSSSSSCSRSSSCSSSGSCSTCNTCDSMSSSSSSSSESRSRSRSYSPEWSRERKFRAERCRKSIDRSRGRSRRSRSPSAYSRSRSRKNRDRSRSLHERDLSKERWREEKKKKRDEEKQQQMKERRIMYVGGIPNSYTRHQLRNRFCRFGEIENVQLHFREHGDNYGFVTFAYTCDAFAAIEKGNSIPGLEKFDLCFGGRRQFCDVEYADLDGNKEVEEEYESKPRKAATCDFDELLRQAQAKLKKS